MIRTTIRRKEDDVFIVEVIEDEERNFTFEFDREALAILDVQIERTLHDTPPIPPVCGYR